MRPTDVTGTYNKLYKHGKAAILTGIITTSLAVGVTGVVAKADELTGDSAVTEQEETGASLDERDGGTLKPVASSLSDEDTGSTSVANEVAGVGTGDLNASSATEKQPRSRQDQPTPTSLKLVDDDRIKQVAVGERRADSTLHKVRSVAAIPVPAPSPTPRASSIDEWMPDKNLQQLVLWQLQRGLADQATYPQRPGLAIKTVDEITPEMLSDNLYELDADVQKQLADQDFFYMTTSISSLKGLEHATNLREISIYPDLLAVDKWDHELIEYGAVEDIAALAGLKNLTSVNFQLNQITDISALANKTLDTVSFSQNNITDLSPLKHSLKPNAQVGFSDQAIYLPAIPLGKDDSFVFDQFTIKDIDGTVIPLKGVDDANGYDLSSDGTWHNVSPNKIVWSQLSADGGYLFMDWDISEGDYEGFSGEITQEFTIDPNIGREETAIIHYNYANGKKAAPDKTVTGKYGQPINFPASPIISGYTASPLPVAKYGATKNEFTVTYTKAKTPPVVMPNPMTTVTVHYQTLVGQQLAADQILTGHPGEAYTTTAASVPGYTLIATPTNATGAFGNTDMSVNYYYEVAKQPSTNEPDDGAGDQGVAQPETPAVVTPDPTPDDGGAAANIVDEIATDGNTVQLGQPDKQSNKLATGQGTTNKPQQILPKTGEAQGSPFWGFAIISGLIGRLRWRVSSKKN